MTTTSWSGTWLLREDSTAGRAWASLKAGIITAVRTVLRYRRALGTTQRLVGVEVQEFESGHDECTGVKVPGTFDGERVENQV